jgi:hypothetical protein
MSGGVFICYRREDSAGFARRIYDRLASGLGREKVFFDVDAIAHGIDFVNAISERVGKCDALVVVISPNWIRTGDVNGRRRLDDPNDLVRIEIEAALARQVRVIPVVVDGANLPKASELPESLKPLARRQGMEISDDRFDSDVDRLIRALSSLMEALRQREVAELEGATGQAGERREAVEAPANTREAEQVGRSAATEAEWRVASERSEREGAAREVEHLFISYCNEDESDARSLVDDLEKRGRQCWFASRDVQFNYQREIVEAIRSAAALIVIISERANSSEEIPKEVSLARKYKVRTIPVRIEDTWPSGALEYELLNAQNVDLFKGRDAAISRLIRLLGPAGEVAAEAERAARKERERQAVAKAPENVAEGRTPVEAEAARQSKEDDGFGLFSGTRASEALSAPRPPHVRTY